MKFLLRFRIFSVKTIWANTLAFAAGVVYLAQTIFYTFTQKSMLDEGQFLYKGLMYAMGVYRPFQDYGFWTHKAPLSYLIPGYIQLWFGPSLGVGRIFAVLISLLGLFGLWMAARRLGGDGWAAAAVWALALNPTVIKLDSVAISQGLVFCLLVWSIVFSVGERRHTYQLIIGAVLATVMVLCRQNMIPFLPLLLIYIWWQYGFRRFAWATGAALVVFFGVQAIYWPGILRMWAPFIPHALAPFLDPWRPPRGDSVNWNINVRFIDQLTSSFSGFRYHFIALNGGMAALLFARRGRDWKYRWQYRAFIFLAVSFVVLTGLHLWLGTGNSDSNNYNVWGFTPYLPFFVSLGLLLIILTASSWDRKLNKFVQAAAVLMILVMSAGIGYSSFETFGYTLMNQPFLRWLEDFSVPHLNTFFRTGKLIPGLVPLTTVLAEKLGTDKIEFLRRFDSALTGLVIGAAILLISLLLWKAMRRNKLSKVYTFGATAMIVFLVAGSVLSPTVLLGGDYKVYDCGSNVIANFQQAGQSLAQVIPAGSKVYWDGNAISVLLSIPNARVFPQLIDGGWSYWNGGDADTLARYGYWNEDLKAQWLQQADFLIFQQSDIRGNWEIYRASSKYEELNVSPLPLGCAPNTYLRVFHKK